MYDRWWITSPPDITVIEHLKYFLHVRFVAVFSQSVDKETNLFGVEDVVDLIPVSRCLRVE